MTPEQIERNRAFIRDLRANKRKAKHKMRAANGARCCMCVAYDTAKRLGAKLPDHDASLPPIEVGIFFGWPKRKDKLRETNPKLRVGKVVRAASSLNDGDDGAPELTHAEIADAFEATFPEIKA